MPPSVFFAVSVGRGAVVALTCLHVAAYFIVPERGARVRLENQG